jgi:hypothetical protein
VPKRPKWLPPEANAYGWRRLPGTAKNYRNVSDTSRPIGQVISERQMANISRVQRFGEKISKERYEREVRTGQRQYISPETSERQRRASAGKLIKNAALIVKYNIDGGYDQLTDDEKDQFHDLFKRYPKDAVREALGSPRSRRTVYRYEPERRRKAA